MRNSLARFALLALAAAALSAPLAAQAPVQVADLNTTRYDSGDNFLSGSEFVELSGTVYFTASDVLHGLELWKTDGTDAGTERVTDLCPGSCDSMVRNLTVAGTSIYFSAEDGAHGTEPWITDGTTAGTRIIKDTTPGFGSSFPHFFHVLGGRVFYSGRDAEAGTELWVTDGTAGGTGRLVDIEPGIASSDATPWQVIGSDLFFAAYDSVHGMELWATDGTVSGTRLVLDIMPGGDSSLSGSAPAPGPAFFGVLGSRLFFAAKDGTAESELWASDGTAAGTTRVADIYAGTDGSFPRDFARLGTKLLFRARDLEHGGELWSTDGTEAGTVLVADILPGPDFATPFELVPFDGAVYFHADDGVHGRELWKSDGTAAGTTMVADIRPGGSAFDIFLSPHGLGPVGSRLLFFADDGVSGNELWATDGTAAGTAQVADLNPGANPSDPGSFNNGREIRVVSGGRWFFRAFDGPFAEGRQLYSSDGTAAGTGRIKRLVEQRSGVTLPFFGRALDSPPAAAAGSRLIFAGDDGVSGGEPAASDGTASGTGLLADVNPGFDTSSPAGMTSLGAKVLFRVSNGPPNDVSLWATDGTSAGTTALAVDAQPNYLTPFSGSAYFSAVDAAHGAEVWKSDGTPGGTGLAFDLVSGPNGSNPAFFTPLAGRLYFTAADSAAGYELWVTDGATANRVADIAPGAASGFPTQLTPSPNYTPGPAIFFAADDGTHGRELWISDGSAAGTHLVRDLAPGLASSIEASPTESFNSESGATMVTFPGGLAVFAASDVPGDEELWASGGSTFPGATFLLGNIRPGPEGSQPRHLTRVGQRIVFVADDGVHGREMWVAKENLTAMLLADIMPGAASSVPQYLTGFGGLVLFSAGDGTHGREPWVTDGTPEGTRRLADIGPGALPSSPYAFTAVGGDFYFAATDAVSGFELWRVPRSSLGAHLTATKQVTGQFVAGGLVTYTIVLTNAGPGAQLRNSGVQLEDPISPVLALQSVSATSGTITHAVPGPQINWSGEIPAGSQVTITMTFLVLAGTPPETIITNQATVHFDSDGDLIDDTDVSTDDPGQPGGQDGTTFRVGLGYYTVPPCRAFDSRSGPPVLNGFTQTVSVAGTCGVSATAKAVAWNITAITPTGAGFLRAYPSGASPTLVSQINFSSGQTRTNNGVIEIGADGKIVVAAALTGGAVSYVFDVVGYFE